MINRASLKRRARLATVYVWKACSTSWPWPGALLLLGCDGLMLLHFRHSVKLMWMHECLTDIIAMGGLLGGLRLACYCWKRGSRVQIAERYRILLEVIESNWIVSMAVVMYGLSRAQHCYGSDGHVSLSRCQIYAVDVLKIAVFYGCCYRLKYVDRKPAAEKAGKSLKPRRMAVKGLCNLGNTCYFNSVMQNICATELLDTTLIEVTERAEHTSEAPLTQELVDFYHSMREPDTSSFNPFSLFNQLCDRSSRFRGGRQQDSHEALRHLMDGIKDEHKKLKMLQQDGSAASNMPTDVCSPLTVIDSVFGGHFLTIFHCENCHTPYHLFEPFLDISLPIAFEEEERAAALAAAIQQTTSECASEQNMETTEQKVSCIQSTDTETGAQKGSSFKDGDQGVDDVEQQMCEYKREEEKEEDDDADEIHADAKTVVEHGANVEEKAETQSVLSGTESEVGEVEPKIGDTGCAEETLHEHAIPAGNQPATEHDAAETELEHRLSAKEAHSDAAHFVSGSERLPGTVDRDDDRGAKDSDQNVAKSQEKPEQQIPDVEIQENLSHIEKHRDGTEVKISNTATESDVDDATSLDLTGASDKPLTAETDTEGQSELEDESKGVSAEIKTQTECPQNEAAEKQQRVSEDDDKPDSEREHHQARKVESPLGHPDYLAAVNMVKERLKKTTEKSKPNDNSVLNSLRFYTREEYLDEYYCLTCNEGLTDYAVQNGTKQTLIFNPPAILTIHLKRFEQTSKGYMKVSRHIAFEEYLDLTPYCTRFAWRQQPDNGEESFQYRLYGVVVHGGLLAGGHYTACVRVRTVDIKSAKKFLQKTFLDREKMMTKEELIKLVADDLPRERLTKRTHYKCEDPAADEWFDISDSHVRRVNLNDVYRKEAYLLFYERTQ